MEYTPQQFDLPSLTGISDESVQEHLGLYEGYVKNFNAMTTHMDALFADETANQHALAELIRRRSFEFGGMRLHEHYFTQFEHGSHMPAADGAFEAAIVAQFGTWEEMIRQVTTAAMLRGPGWALLYYDNTVQRFRIGFTGEQHQGHFVTLPIMLALDVWEHAFLKDYGAAGKAGYVSAFFENVNWQIVEARFEAAQK